MTHPTGDALAAQAQSIVTKEMVADCEVCGGDCAGANPPIYNCPNIECAHAWAMQDAIGSPFCAGCGKPWHEVNPATTIRNITKAKP